MISEKQWIRLLQKGSTVNLKGFTKEQSKEKSKVEGLIRFNDAYQLVLEPKIIVKPITDTLPCPKCKKGTVLKGKSAYGCSHHSEGCDFRVSFDAIREKAKGKALTKTLVHSILNTFSS
jgi:DNA topoisomerase-3